MAESRPDPPAPVAVRAARRDDLAWVERVAEPVGGTTVVSLERVHRLDALPGLVAEQAGERAGFAFHHTTGDACELVAIEAVPPLRGVGTALLAAVEAEARRAGCARLWLVTTNDNLDALRFYQRRGLALVAVHPNAMERVRAVKPDLPLTGDDGIPLRDMLELEKRLLPGPTRRAAARDPDAT